MPPGLREPSDLRADSGPVSFDFTRVRAQAIVKMFGATRALAGVDLTLEAGRVTVIEGPDGAGKSTLLDILSLLVAPRAARCFSVSATPGKSATSCGPHWVCWATRPCSIPI